MKQSGGKQVLLKGSDVCEILGMGKTAGYRYLKHLAQEDILTPVKLPGIKTPRYNKNDVIMLTTNKEDIVCEKFVTNQ